MGGYNTFAPYSKVEADLIAHGFDVLVFVPSMDEETSTVTCGNAILGGSQMTNQSKVISIIGVDHSPLTL